MNECNCKRGHCGLCNPVLIVTFKNLTDKCNCFDNITFGITYNNYEWVGNFKYNQTKYIFILNYAEHAWSIMGIGENDSSLFQIKEKSISDKPLFISFKNINKIDFCEGSLEIHITS